jgi:hypothetical protein
MSPEAHNSEITTYRDRVARLEERLKMTKE